LDEATSSIDSVSENRIQAALDNIMTTRTTIVIAHRLTTIINVDTIYVLEEGSIVEKGNHPELLERRGLYHQLWTAQMKERERHAHSAEEQAASSRA
jgi:ABC-type multidrug transport system fused ATPase/permease subunit